NYYLLFGSFEDGEGSFGELEPQKLDFYHPSYSLHKKVSTLKVSECYEERGMSDFLKIGLGKLASAKVQQVFFEHGFTGIQFLPVVVKNEQEYTDYAFINPIAHYDLLDPVASEAEDFCDSIGGYSWIYKPLIDRKKLNETNFKHDCFTLSTIKQDYYVNETVKLALEAAGVKGITFMPMEFSS
ncbi:hypothetical protein, partial [Photobacterium nomapromontoriensis]|uniref:hypothetical protein n=1 Tax=Photobacterium nomapromontoriensis TaxID=2910237 RepID=UPI003D0ABD10